MPKAGIEPARYYLPQDFKSCASTYSAIQAYIKNGDPEAIRTPDPLIKSQLLYRLSYGVKWCRLQELNPQPTDYKSVALPIELSRQMVENVGLEPTTPCL